MIPRFWTDMPPARPGLWQAEVWHELPTGRRTIVWSGVCRGLRRAYVWVRLRAFLDDLLSPWHDGEMAIVWVVRRYGEDQADCGLGSAK